MKSWKRLQRPYQPERGPKHLAECYTKRAARVLKYGLQSVSLLWVKASKNCMTFLRNTERMQVQSRSLLIICKLTNTDSNNHSSIGSIPLGATLGGGAFFPFNRL